MDVRPSRAAHHYVQFRACKTFCVGPRLWRTCNHRVWLGVLFKAEGSPTRQDKRDEAHLAIRPDRFGQTANNRIEQNQDTDSVSLGDYNRDSRLLLEGMPLFSTRSPEAEVVHIQIMTLRNSSIRKISEW